MKMPKRFELLAAYNDHLARGIQHDPQVVETMARMQEQFDQWQHARFVIEHPSHRIIDVPGGGVLAVPVEMPFDENALYG